MSPRITSSRPRNFAMDGRFARVPVEKLSNTRTRAPSASSRSTRWEPMNPAPPVTSTASFTPPIVAFDSLGDFAPSWRHLRAALRPGTRTAMEDAMGRSRLAMLLLVALVLVLPAAPVAQTKDDTLVYALP